MTYADGIAWLAGRAGASTERHPDLRDFRELCPDLGPNRLETVIIREIRSLSVNSRS